MKKEEKEKKEKEKKKNSWEVSAVPCQADAAGRALVPLHRIPPRLRDAVACSPLTSVPAHACWRGSSPACVQTSNSLVGPCAQAEGEGAIKAVTHSCLSAALPTFIA